MTAATSIRRQLALPLVVPVALSLPQESAESRGAVFTRREVVDFILDLAGYTVDQPLRHCRLQRFHLLGLRAERLME